MYGKTEGQETAYDRRDSYQSDMRFIQKKAGGATKH